MHRHRQLPFFRWLRCVRHNVKPGVVGKVRDWSPLPCRCVKARFGLEVAKTQYFRRTRRFGWVRGLQNKGRSLTVVLSVLCRQWLPCGFFLLYGEREISHFHLGHHLWLMHPLGVTHWTLIQKRTHIRHDKLVLRLIQRCWQAATPLTSMNRDGYDGMYRKLLGAMTISWDEDVFQTIVDVMWQRDAQTFLELDINRFSCSIFAFAEMWVESIDAAEYSRVLQWIQRILSATNSEHAIRRSNPTSLAAFLEALRQENQLEAAGLCIGKSTMFDPERYAETFGRTVPESVCSLVPSMDHKSARRHTATNLPLPDRRGQSVDSALLAHVRPRSSSVMVRTTDTKPSTAATFHINSKKLVIHRPRPVKESTYRIKS